MPKDITMSFYEMNASIFQSHGYWGGTGHCVERSLGAEGSVLARCEAKMYDDVNVELKDAEPANKEKGDGEMTQAENVNAEHEEVSQEVACDQVKDDAQVTVTAAPATQKTEVPLQSSSISSDYATKFLNFDNIRFPSEGGGINLCLSADYPQLMDIYQSPLLDRESKSLYFAEEDAIDKGVA
ncbi:hypothetical protein Tco_0479540 [Tanacetum coccineum]